MGDPPSASLPLVSREELRAKIEAGEPFALVDALPPMSYAHSHLPGAINLPPEQVDELAARRIPDRTTEIVVYCANEGCDSSVETGRRLIELGYTRVCHYRGGKQDWLAASLPVDGKASRLIAGRSTIHDEQAQGDEIPQGR